MALTGFVYHSDYLEHDMGHTHPESPQRLRAIVGRLEETGLLPSLVRINPKPATDDWITQVHEYTYVKGLRQRAPQKGYVSLDPDTSMSPGSLGAAYLAAGGALSAVDAIMEKRVDNAFCAVRPPGHHAESDHAMGFCLFNNVAIAARYFQKRYGLERIAIVDWDVHHGNGTSEIFYASSSVLYASIHQSPLYPGTGAINEQGADKGFGCNLNIPLPPGATGDVYVAGLDRVVAPLVQVFEPTWLLISAGFDAHRRDPLTDLGLTSGDFGLITRRLIELVPTAKRIMVLEGGYDLQALADSSGAAMAALLGVDDEPEKPTAGGPGHRVLDTVSERWGDLLPS